MMSFRTEREFGRLLFVVLFIGTEWRLPSCDALPVFIRGRPRGGMLGSPLPPNDYALAASFLPPNMWLTQRLDHFHPSDTRTWKQVMRIVIVIHAVYEFKSSLKCTLMNTLL